MKTWFFLKKSTLPEMKNLLGVTAQYRPPSQQIYKLLPQQLTEFLRFAESSG